MITVLRHFLVDSWFGRCLAFLVFLSFVGLGGTFLGLGQGGDSMLMGGGGVVSIGSDIIKPDELARAIRMQVNFALQNGISEGELQNPHFQDQLSHEALRNLIFVKEISQMAKDKGIIISDNAIREKIFAMHEFSNEKGQFDPAKMEALLKRNQLTHQFLIDHARQELQNEAAFLGLGQNAQPSSNFINYLVHFYGRVRVADIYHIGFNEGQVPKTASDEVLKRFYLNHLSLFREAEFRHARIVVMTPQTIASSLQVTDDKARYIYEERLKTNARDYNLPETRSVHVLTFSDEKKAQDALEYFAKGAGLEEIIRQKTAIISTQLEDARKTDFPDEALAKAAFEENMKKSKENIVGPVKTAGGWSLVDILSIKPPHHISFEEARPEIIKQIQQSEVASILHSRIKAFQEAVAGSTDLSKIPADLGAVAYSGMLNDKGETQEGTKAPLPNDNALKTAIIKQVFAQDKKALPHVIIQPDGSAFALITDEIHPGAQKSFEQAHTQILLAWQQEQKKHAANQRATDIYLAAKKNTLRDAVEKIGDIKNLQKDVTVSVVSPPQTLPSRITEIALRLPVNGAKMIEDGDNFWVVHINSENLVPQAEQDALKERFLEQETHILQNDVSESLAMSYMQREIPRHFNPKLFEEVKESIFPQGAQ